MVVKGVRSKDSAYWLQKKHGLRIVHTGCKKSAV